MKRARLLLFSLILLCVCPRSHAQSWAGIIDPKRAIDWSTAGVTGGIPNRTTICSTLNPGATVAQINNALNACPSGQVVFLSAGSYSLSGTINMRSNVTLRGAGANQTKLTFTSAGTCQAGPCAVNFEGSFVDNGQTNPSPFGSPAANTKSWSGTNGQAGVYTKGATDVNLSSVTGSPNLAVGDTLVLFQQDVSSPTNGAFICQTAPGPCSREGSTGSGQQQQVKVVAINGTAVTIAPGLHSAEWSSAKTPQAYWRGGTLVNSGIENLSIEVGALSVFGVINFWAAGDCWAKGILTHETASRDHILVMLSRNMTIQDSYFRDSCLNGCAGGATGYGLETWSSSSILEQNNILDNIQAAWVMSETCSGCVLGYNYEKNLGDGNETALALHEEGNIYWLFEGNNTNLVRGDTYHGTMHLQTAFRNILPGNNSGQAAMDLWAYNRYWNVIGNVLGTVGVSGRYQCLSPDSSTQCSRFGGPPNAIYRLGFAGENAGAGPEVGVVSDNVVWSSIMRWGNYDTVSAAVRFVSAEVPTTDPSYPNAVPASQTLPPSFYLSSKPAWWPSAKPWPAVGPDVLGGNLANLAGHAFTLPAQDCYISLGGSYTNFNAATCYVLNTVTAPAPPTGLQAIVH